MIPEFPIVFVLSFFSQDCDMKGFWQHSCYRISNFKSLSTASFLTSGEHYWLHKTTFLTPQRGTISARARKLITSEWLSQIDRDSQKRMGMERPMWPGLQPDIANKTQEDKNTLLSFQIVCRIHFFSWCLSLMSRSILRLWLGAWTIASFVFVWNSLKQSIQIIFVLIQPA